MISFFGEQNKRSRKKVVLSDMSNLVISVCEYIRDYCGSLGIFLESLSTTEKKLSFVRDNCDFYKMPIKELSAWFLLVNQMAYSGLVTVNSKSGNKAKISIGKNRKFIGVNLENLKKISIFLKPVRIIQRDRFGFGFISEAQEKDLVLIDLSQPKDRKTKRILQFYYDYSDPINTIRLAKDIEIAKNNGARIAIISNEFTDMSALRNIGTCFRTKNIILNSFYFQSGKHTESAIAKSYKITKNF